MPTSGSSPRVTILASDEVRLREWLEGHPEGHERAAVLSPRYVLIDVIPMTDDWIIDSSPSHVDFRKANLQPLYHRCQEEQLVLGFAHNHPSGPAWFSEKDDQNESSMVARLGSINEPDSELVALLLHDGAWYARVRSARSPGTTTDARHVAVVGDQLTLHVRESVGSMDDDVLARQEAAFGRPFTTKMRSLRFCVIGAGGTGSPTATLLARSGAGEVVIIDHDQLEVTNLNRVRGARRTNVDENKAVVLANFITSLELGGKALAVPARLQTSEAMDALCSADVVFGCTDGETSRDVLNTAVHFYAQVYIDMGLGGSIGMDVDGAPRLRTHAGRVNIMTPESGRCLYCHRVISEDQVRYEDEVERRPWLKKLSAEQLLAEHYLRNSGGEQSPGVGPFTSATADFAVMTLFDLIKPFRRLPEDVLRDCVRIDFVGARIYSNAPLETTDCPYCQDRAFRLKSERGLRLRRPALGSY